jgi:putative membrane protein
MSKTTLSLAVAAVLAASSAASISASAQTMSNNQPRAMHAAVQTRGMSQEYVQKAAVSDMFEVESSKLALQRSEKPDVKAFAQRMIDDHTKSTQKLKSVLQTASVGTAPATALDRSHQRMLDQLQNASNAQFDRLYMQMQIKGHQDALKVQQQYGRKGDNDQLRTFASDAAPMVQDHLAQARQILRGLGKNRGA